MPEHEDPEACQVFDQAVTQDEDDLLGPVPYFEVTEPGRYDMPDAVYHSDPVPDPGSLSSTGLRTLLRSPAKFAYWRGKSITKRVFDVGSAAHMLVLGQGPELVEVRGDGADENAWRTNSDKIRERAARDAGKLPLRPSDFEQVHEMAYALQQNKEVAELLSGGTAEEAFFAKDPVTGMWMRGKTDYRHEDHTLIDYKTSAKPVDADTFGRTMTAFGYHVQFAYYRHILVVLGLIAPSTPFLAIAQEKEPPYLCAVLRPDVDAMAFGHAEAQEGLRIFQHGVFNDHWPGYPSEPVDVSLSGWKLREYELAGVEPVYTDRVGMALERIQDARTRAELRSWPLIFPELRDHADVKAAANARWTALGKSA